MERPEPRYSVGDKLKDKYTGKVAVVTNMYCSERAGWAYFHGSPRLLLYSRGRLD